MAEKHHVPAEIADLNPRYLLFLNTLSYISAVIVTLVGSIVFCGWITRTPAMIYWTGTVYPRTNASLCFLLSGIALILLIPKNIGSLRLWAGRICALAVLVIAGMTLSEHLFKFHLGIDQLIATDTRELHSVVSPNRMGPPASTCFTLTGLTLAVLAFWPKRAYLAQRFGAAIFLIAMFPAVGYLYDAEQFYGVARYTGIAPITAAMFLLLAIAIICSRPREGFAAMLAEDGPGGRILRLFVPFIILVPLVLGYLRVMGEHRNYYDTATGTVALMLIIIFSFMSLLWFNAHRISASTAAQHAAVKALRQSEARMLMERERTPIGCISFDEHNCISQMNPAAEHIFGYSQAEAQGRHANLIVPEAVRPHTDGILRRLAEGDMTAHSVNENVTKDGRTIVCQWTNTPLRDAKRTFVGFLSMVEDITERKKAEEAMRQSEEQFHTMANAMQQLAWIARPDGYIFWYNQRWYDYTGTTAEQMEGWGWQSVHDPALLPKIMEQWKASIATGTLFEMEFPLRGADGRFHQFITRGVPLKDAQGRIVQWFGTNTDINDIKQAEEALRNAYEQIEEQVRQRTEELQKTVQTLQKEVSERLAAEQALKNSQGALRAMASEMSLVEERERRRIALLLHDHIGQLLAVTKIKLGGARKDSLSEGSAKAIDEIRWLTEEAIKSTRLLTLELSPPSLYTLGLSAALSEMCEKFTAEHRIVCSFEDDGKLKTLPEDVRAFLFRSAGELLHNAIKHSNASAAKVSISKDNNHVELKIADNGIGFDPAELESQPAADVGFGLMSIRERITHLGGSFSIESEKGKGTTVTLKVPVI